MTTFIINFSSCKYISYKPRSKFLAKKESSNDEILVVSGLALKIKGTTNSVIWKSQDIL